MKQLEINFFWPLTEQIPLDLDYTPSTKYAENKRNESFKNGVIDIRNGGTFTITASKIEPNFTIDIDQTPITIVSKEKPGLFRSYIYKILGMKWKSK